MEFLGVSLYQPDNALQQCHVNTELLASYIEALKQVILSIHDEESETRRCNVIVVLRGLGHDEHVSKYFWITDERGGEYINAFLESKLMKVEAPQFEGPLAFALQFGSENDVLSSDLPTATVWRDLTAGADENLIFPEGFISLIWPPTPKKENRLKNGFISRLFGNRLSD